MAMRNPPLASLALIAASAPCSAQSCSCDISDRFEASYDALLFLDNEEAARSLRVHLPWGRPTESEDAENETLLANDDYVVCHDADLRVPLWGAYRLDHFDVDHDRKRTECFRPDPRLAEDETATCDDYRGSGHDRGHIVPSDAVGRTEASMVNSYVLSNMAPQVGRFNQVHWKFLEDRARRWAEDEGPVWVIVGCVFDRDDDGARDPDEDAERLDSVNSPDRVAIPSHFYMIVTTQRPDGFLDTRAVLLEHDEDAVPRDVRTSTARRAWLDANAMVSIDEIEALTGHDFFPSRTDEEEADFEAGVATGGWW